MKIALSKQQLCGWYLSLVALFFAFSPLPGGSSYRYLFFVATPSCLIVLLLKQNKTTIKASLFDFVNFIRPIFPFLFALCIVWAIHRNGTLDQGIGGEARLILLIFVLNGLVYTTLKIKRVVISNSLFLFACSLSIVLAIVYFFVVAYNNDVSIFHIRPFVKPYVTIFAKCLALLSGLTLLGALIFPKLPRNSRLFFSTIGLLGFLGSSGFLSVRGTLLVPFIVLFCAGFFYGFKRVKVLLFSGLAICVLSTALFSLTPIGERIQVGVNEVQSVATTPLLENLFEKILSKEVLSAEEENVKRAVNNSMGARVAVWKLALYGTRGHELFGIGVSRPQDILDVKSLFSYSKDYLPHFHSDFVQVYVMGGVFLLLGFLSSIFLFFFQSRENCLKLFLLLSLLSFGIVDPGFLELRTMTVFAGAWAILSLPSYENDCSITPLRR